MTDKEKLSVEKQIAIYDMLNARCTVTDEGVDGFLTWKQIKDIYNSISEEPVSDDLEEASKEWLSPQLDKSYAAYGETKQMELTRFDGYAMLDAIEFGANWQRKQDQETIELAEDHAMLAGMEKMKEQMMAKAIDGDITFDYYGDDDKTYGCIAHDSFCLEDFGLKDTDKVKMILIKED